MATILEEPPTAGRRSRIYVVRMQPRLQAQVEALAERDANTISATMRRLISAGLRIEERRDAEGGER